MEDYFGIDDLLASDEKVLVRFLVQAPGLQFLNSTPALDSDSENDSESDGSDTENANISNSAPRKAQTKSRKRQNYLPVNSVVYLPFWMAERLAVRNVVTVQLPPALGQLSRAQIDAGSLDCSLRRKSLYFYRLGSNLFNLLQTGDLPEWLQNLFSERSWKIVDMARNIYTDDTFVAPWTNSRRLDVQKLDETEKVIYNISRQAALAEISWKERSSDKIVSVTPTVLGKRRISVAA